MNEQMLAARMGIDYMLDLPHLPKPENDVCFWYEVNHRTYGPELKIDVLALIKFLESKGYKKLKIDSQGLNTLFIQENHNVISECNLSVIRNRLLNDYVDDLPEKITTNFNRENLRTILTKGINAYIEPCKLDKLAFVRIDFMRDSETKSYYFFKNGFVEISEDEILLKSYRELPGKIWQTQIIDFDIDILNDANDYNDCDYSIFTQRICSKTDSNGCCLDQDRYLSLKTVIGYLLNNYNCPAYRKAVILSDSNLEPNPEGRVGKGLLLKGIGQLRKVTVIDAKNMKYDSPFVLQQVDLDTQIIFFDDCKKDFVFEQFFSSITESYSIEKKNQKRFNFDEISNPKTAFSTNYAIKGDGASHRARRFEMELYNYYSDSKTPFDEFGKYFFTMSWDRKEWNRFYNFMFHCVQKFLRNNGRMLDFGRENLDRKKLIVALGKNFVDFADKLQINQKYRKSELYNDFCDFNDISKEYYKINKFGSSLKRYVKSKGLNLETIKNRGNSDSFETYYCITENSLF